MEMPVEEYFKEFELWFAQNSLRFAGHKLVTRYLDPALQIDMVDLGYNYQAKKDYLIGRFKRVPNCPASDLVSDH